MVEQLAQSGRTRPERSASIVFSSADGSSADGAGPTAMGLARPCRREHDRGLRMDAGDRSCMFVARLSVLSKLGALAGTLEYEKALLAVARLAIPELADWCIVDVVDEGEARRVHVAHRDPARATLAEALQRFPLDHASRVRLPAATAARSGRPVLIADLSEATLRGQTDGEYLELIRQLGVCSLLVIPVTLSTSIATVAFLMTSESGRRYGQEDLALAEELVRRAAQIVENARVHQQLLETEERFRVALAHSNITVFEQDAQGRYRWIYNPPLGYRASEVVGKTTEELVGPGEAALLDPLDRAVLGSGERVHGEVQIRQRGGEVRHLLVSREPLRDVWGGIVGITGAATDITDQKRVQEELAQALTFREQMMGVLGHDLRGPLGAVRALSSLLLRRQDLPESAREPIGEMGSAAQRMLELIRALLDFTDARFNGALRISPVATNLHQLCRRIVRELRAAAPGRAIELELQGDGSGTWDPARMGQVVSNLVSNALQHGERHAPVRVSVTGDEDSAVLVVANQGPAIEPELMPVLFEPFCRGSALRASSAPGLGLGLFIVKQVVSAHGGSVGVDSTAERGTAFTVRLPRAGVASQQGTPGQLSA
jgi:PAS domain S-box-containing protein